MIEFSPIKFMAVIFTPDFAFGDKFSIINLFQELSGKKFAGELFSAPIPHEAPPEIPRIILNSKLNDWRLEVSLDRTNLVYSNPAFSPITDPEALDFVNFARKLFRSYKKASKVGIQRLAFITERVAKIKKKAPSQFIADTFCKEDYLKEPFNNTNSFELHSLKQYEFKKFNLNSWVRLKAVRLAEKQTPVLLVVSDINTLSFLVAPDVKFQLKDIDRFFINIPKHLESILSLYFK